MGGGGWGGGGVGWWCGFFFFFNDTATTEIYTLSLHDALPIWSLIVLLLVGLVGLVSWWLVFVVVLVASGEEVRKRVGALPQTACCSRTRRSEEHTSELQSLTNLVCRLLLEKKKNKKNRDRKSTRLNSSH